MKVNCGPLPTTVDAGSITDKNKMRDSQQMVAKMLAR